MTEERHCATCICGRRAPVQMDFQDAAYLGRPAKGPGTISWAEHEKAWEVYAQRYGTRQDAERIAQRGGFAFGELIMFLGREPETWVPQGREQK